jgi:2'-5' RNA ligase
MSDSDDRFVWKPGELVTVEPDEESDNEEEPAEKVSKGWAFARWCKRWRDKGQHEFSSTQFNLEGAALEHVRRLQAQIDPADMTDKGAESVPHVTVRYGLEGSDAGPVRQLVETFGPVPTTLGAMDCFEGEETDVVILRVDSDDLRRLNALLGELPHQDTHPTYQPHVTLAYVKPGLGAKHVELAAEQEADRSGREPVDAKFTELVFSPKEGEPTLIPLNSYPATEKRKSEPRLKSALKPSPLPVLPSKKSTRRKLDKK